MGLAGGGGQEVGRLAVRRQVALLGAAVVREKEMGLAYQSAGY